MIWGVPLFLETPICIGTMPSTFQLLYHFPKGTGSLQICPWRIYGTNGIFPYMDGWFLWFSCRYIYIYRSHGSHGILWIATENIAGKWTCPRCLASIPSLTKTNSSHLIMDGSFHIFQRRQHEYWAPKKVGFLEGKSPYFRENPGYTSIIVCRSYCVLSSPGHTWKSWESQRPSGAFKVGRLVQYGSIWPRWLEDVLLSLLSKVVWTHLWNTPQATFTNRLFQAISFIVG